jgi:hypothetical protein
MKSVITITNVGENLDLGLAAILGSVLSVISCSTSPSSSHRNFGSLRLDHFYKNWKVVNMVDA